jgi:hypothetical protein
MAMASIATRNKLPEGNILRIRMHQPLVPMMRKHENSPGNTSGYVLCIRRQADLTGGASPVIIAGFHKL